jgi:hypothetical protein
VGVGSDQLDAGKTAGGQIPPEGEPARTVLTGSDLHAEDLAVPVGVDAGRDEHVDGHYAASLTNLQDQCVGRDERERSGVLEASGAELLDVLVELPVIDWTSPRPGTSTGR